MSDSKDSTIDDNAVTGADRRALFELQERVEELTVQLNIRIQAEQLHELELSSIGRDLAVTKAYNEMLEKSAAQELQSHQRTQELTHQHIQNIDRIYQVDLPAAVKRAELAEAQIPLLTADRDAAVHQRNQTAQELQEAVQRAESETAKARSEAAEAQAELDQLRSRRVVKITGWVSENPLVKRLRSR